MLSCLLPGASALLHSSTPKPLARGATLLPATLLCLMLATTAARAQESLSPPISGSVSDPIYSESTQNGPSSSLVEGDNTLTNPYNRQGTSDPLAFLIESSLMSPYPLSSTVNGYVDSFVQTQVVNDSTVAERFSEYRENHLLMSGTGSTSLLHGRASAAGRIASGSNPRASGSAMQGFAGLSTRASFAAGSSGLAVTPGESSPSSFVDPNALLAAANSSAVLNSSTALDGGQGEALGSATVSSQGSQPGMQSAGAMTASAATSMAASASLPISSVVPPPTGIPSGPEPGSIFPDISVSGPSSTGFVDTTMGTAGLLSDSQSSGMARTPLLREDPPASPFRTLSTGGASFLNPSLLQLSTAGTEQRLSGTPVSELARRARLHAMIYNPGAPLPSAFVTRKMERDYLRKGSGRRPSRYPAITAPSIKP